MVKRNRSRSPPRDAVQLPANAFGDRTACCRSCHKQFPFLDVPQHEEGCVIKQTCVIHVKAPLLVSFRMSVW